MSGSSVARIIVVVLFLVALSLPFTIASSSQAQDKPVETVRKNIQVLKGMPDSQLFPVMNLMSTALGVRCNFCHIAENGKYQLDDRPAKATARKMIEMTFAINKANFNGETEVTCNTCHRGSTRPVGTPAIALFENTPRAAEPPAKPADTRPSVDDVFNKYLQAIGGKAAVEKIQTRLSEASLQRPALVNPSGKPSTIQIYQKAPNKMSLVITAPDGSVTYQGFNGTTGWIKSPTEQRELTAAELAQVKQQAELHKEVTLKDQYSGLRVGNKQKVNDRDAYVVVGMNTSTNKRERLFFDAETGLLVRRVVLNLTVLGVDPVQTDFSDYREVDGVKLPFTIQISSLDNNHNAQMRTFSQIKQNVPVDDAKFEPPPK